MEEVGAEGLRRLVAAFYRRVREDDLIGPMYPAEDWDGAEERLTDFLLFRFGADETYLQKRGHPRLRMRHAPFRIGIAERDRWLALMGGAMDEVSVPKPSRLFLDSFFAEVADFMRNQQG